MHEVLVNCLGGLSLPRKSVVRLTGRPNMILDIYRRRKTTKQQQQKTMWFIVKGGNLRHSSDVIKRVISGHLDLNKLKVCNIEVLQTLRRPNM